MGKVDTGNKNIGHSVVAETAGLMSKCWLSLISLSRYRETG